MFSQLLKQPYNYWRSSGTTFQIQFVLVVGLIIVYTSTRLLDQFQLWIDQNVGTISGLSNLMVHIVILIFGLSTPFILIYLVPRQNSIRLFFEKPLLKSQTYSLFSYYILKYHLVLLISIIPVIAAVGIINIIWGFISLLLILIYIAIILNLNISIFFLIRNQFAYLLASLVLILLYFSFYWFFYWILSRYWLFDSIAISMILIVSILLFRRNKSGQLELIFELSKGKNSSGNWRRSLFKRIPNFLPERLQILFNKEFLSLWRNPRYYRLKTLTWWGQIVISSFIVLFHAKNAVLFLTIFTAALIWFHYGSYFNDKYIQADSRWFYQILPVSFFRLFAAKFLSEFSYIVLILLTALPYLLNQQIESSAVIQIMAFLSVYSIIVLLTMVNFQMMFFETPRYAGYAYHFSVLFFVVMAVNYRFVGPLMMLFMMIFYFYKNYRYFKT